MTLRRLRFGRVVALALPLRATWDLTQTSASAQTQFVVSPVVEKRVSQLPAGPLYWRIENLPTLAQAQAAAARRRSSPKPRARSGCLRWGLRAARHLVQRRSPRSVAIPAITAPEYLLRINRATGPPGSMTATHSHPAPKRSTCSLRQGAVTTPLGVKRADAGQSMNGHGADTPMQVVSSGTVDLDQFVMFVVDATKPFSTPAKAASLLLHRVCADDPVGHAGR